MNWVLPDLSLAELVEIVRAVAKNTEEKSR